MIYTSFLHFIDVMCFKFVFLSCLYFWNEWYSFEESTEATNLTHNIQVVKLNYYQKEKKKKLSFILQPTQMNKNHSLERLFVSLLCYSTECSHVFLESLYCTVVYVHLFVFCSLLSPNVLYCSFDEHAFRWGSMLKAVCG